MRFHRLLHLVAPNGIARDVLDSTDLQILALLRQNARMPWKEIGEQVRAIITVFMSTTDHQRFQRFVREREEVVEAHRVSGEGCDSLKVLVSDQTALNRLLDDLLPYGNCRVNISIGQLK